MPSLSRRLACCGGFGVPCCIVSRFGHSGHAPPPPGTMAPGGARIPPVVLPSVLFLRRPGPDVLGLHVVGFGVRVFFGLGGGGAFHLDGCRWRGFRNDGRGAPLRALAGVLPLLAPMGLRSQLRNYLCVVAFVFLLLPGAALPEDTRVVTWCTRVAASCVAYRRCTFCVLIPFGVFGFAEAIGLSNLRVVCRERRSLMPRAVGEHGCRWVHPAAPV